MGKTASRRNSGGTATSGICAMVAAVILGGCATTAYLGQSIGGEFDLLRRARSIDALLADSGTPPDLRARLAAVRAIRDFASQELLLPDNGSYRRYTDLGRPYVVWNVFAAPELSLKLDEWCFPVTGCVSYRGYFAEDAAKQFAGQLRMQGLDVFVAGIPAYSTLGYFDDPVLSSFIRFSEAEIARLLFHELAHQVAYASGDSLFNESFAVAVEREGMRRYLMHAAPGAAVAYALAEGRRAQFLALVNGARLRLQTAYAGAADDAARRANKARAFDALRNDYAKMREGQWGGYAGYDAWFASDFNNAKLGSVALYSARVPAFEALLRQHQGDLAAFYVAANKLAKMTKAGRDAALDALDGQRQPAPTPASTATANQAAAE